MSENQIEEYDKKKLKLKAISSHLTKQLNNALALEQKNEQEQEQKKNKKAPEKKLTEEERKKTMREGTASSARKYIAELERKDKEDGGKGGTKVKEYLDTRQSFFMGLAGEQDEELKGAYEKYMDYCRKYEYNPNNPTG